MAADHHFVSFAPNAEDVVLWRALKHVPRGRYVEVWADRPGAFPVGHALELRGWRGLDVELPSAETTLNALLEEHLGPGDEVHVLVVRAGGSQRATALGALDLRRRRPWVLLVEAPELVSQHAARQDWDAGIRAAGYEARLFDGVFRFFVAHEHAAALGPALDVPAHPGDDFVTDREVQLREELAAAGEELVRWRGTVLARWADAASGGSGGRARQPRHEVVRLREELEATHATLSWRITAPLRAVQKRRLQGWR